MENKVVKCNRGGCEKYFTREGKNIKYCPFCHTEYVEAGDKKVATKPQKEFFKFGKIIKKEF